jgi:hypothetical protein
MKANSPATDDGYEGFLKKYPSYETALHIDHLHSWDEDYLLNVLTTQ